MKSYYSGYLQQRGSAVIYVVLAIIILSAAAGVLFFKVKEPPKAVQEMKMSTGTPIASVLPEVTVYKTATCGCCSKWITHLQN